jgi:tRNA (guanine37-N1)-methyltransferase
MLCIKVPLKDAEQLKKELIRRDLLDKNYAVKKDKEYIHFPVKKKFKNRYEFRRKLLKKKNIQTNLKSSLTTKLKEKDLKFLRKSMDSVGNIAILEIPAELIKKEKLIAKEVLRINKNIKTVLKKGRHEGVYRIQKLEHLTGKKTKETVYKENNVLLKLDVEKVYFSPRLSSERKRIMEMIKKRANLGFADSEKQKSQISESKTKGFGKRVFQKPEDVLVMFSGCAPYVCVIAKNTPAKSVYGIEINPIGHNYAIQNLLLNKLSNAFVFLGDVKTVVPKLKMKFDRVIMPLPKSAEDYLDVAFKVSKKGAIIHFYDFQQEREFEKSVEKIKKACRAAKRGCKILGITKCGQSAPREFRICVDFEIL